MDQNPSDTEKGRSQSARWRAAHREQHRASVSAWRLANPEKARAKDRRAAERRKVARLAKREAHRAAAAQAAPAKAAVRREKARAHYRANRERILEQSRKWRAANPGKSAALQKVWRDGNQEKRRASKRARKAAKRVTLVRELTKLQRGRCAYCRATLGNDFHVDHVMPLKLGGADHRSNLQLACESCNLTKSAQHPVDFAQSLGRLI